VRVQKGEAVAAVTPPFDNTPSSVTAAVVRRSTGATLAVPTTTVSGQRVIATLTSADHTNALDVLDVTVSATVNSLATVQRFTVEVIGSHWFTLGEVRDEPSLNDQTRWPDALLAQFRDEICDFVERACLVRFTPHWGEEDHVGDGRSVLALRTSRPRDLRSVTIDGTAQTVSDLELLAHGVLRHNTGQFTYGEPVVVQVEHGHDRPPYQLAREVLAAVRSRLMARGAQAPKDLLWEQTADGLTVRYTTADPAAGRWTGLQHLDAAIAAWSDRVTGFA
jgi:hypothetical protein